MEDETKFVLSEKKFTKALIGAGLLIYALAFIVMVLIQDVNPLDSWWIKIFKNLCTLLSEIAKIIAGVFMSSGILSIFLELSTIKEVVFKVYYALTRKILNADFDLTNYSIKTLDDLRKRIVIQKHDIKIDLEELDKSVYSLEEKLNDLILSRYYELDEATYWITPIESRKVFKKRVEKTYVIMNHFKSENKVKFSLNFVKDYETQTEEEIKKKIVIEEFIINSTNLTSEVEKYLTVKKVCKSNHSPYDFTVIFERELQECEKHTIILKYEYEVPMTDFTQSYKSYLPCKVFKHKIFIEDEKNKNAGKNIKNIKNQKKNNNWALAVNGFCSFYTESSSAGDFKVLENTDYSAEIWYNGWTLPGAGYVISYRNI